jgi:ubiquinone/menaquinone biosynthesis C-methylase UbiE
LLFRGLSGRILDAGVGTGRNFPFYPPGSEVVGMDLSPAMLVRAERRRGSTHVELRRMDVTRLDFTAHFFDAAVASFLFCTLPDELQVAGMRELGRVVKPGGIIRCLEYTRPSGGLRRALTPAVGAMGLLGLWRGLRPPDRKARSAGGAAARRVPLRFRRAHQAPRRKGVTLVPV